MAKARCECERDAIPCRECAQAASEDRLARLDQLITDYYRDKSRPGQPQPEPRR